MSRIYRINEFAERIGKSTSISENLAAGSTVSACGEAKQLIRAFSVKQEFFFILAHWQE